MVWRDFWVLYILISFSSQRFWSCVFGPGKHEGPGPTCRSAQCVFLTPKVCAPVKKHATRCPQPQDFCTIFWGHTMDMMDDITISQTKNVQYQAIPAIEVPAKNVCPKIGISIRKWWVNRYCRFLDTCAWTSMSQSWMIRETTGNLCIWRYKPIVSGWDFPLNQSIQNQSLVGFPL